MSRDIYEHRHTFDGPTTRKEYIDILQQKINSIPDHQFKRSTRYIYASKEVVEKFNSINKNHGKNI